MTRINVVPPEELSRQHLIAEYRELPRVFTLATAAYERGEYPDDPRNPTEYVLGKGHVRFFYTRLGFLQRRFILLGSEMRRRGYVPKFTMPPAAGVPEEWYQGYVPTAEALALNRARIAERSR